MGATDQLKREWLQDFRAKSYIRTNADLLRLSAAIDRFLMLAAARGLDTQEIEALSRGGIHFAALLELIAQDIR